VSASRVIIFGAGAGADTAYRHLVKDSAHEVCAFTVEQSFLKAVSLHGLPVVPFESVAERFPPDAHRMFVPLGFQRMNALREEKYLAARALGYRCISYVSSRVFSLEPPVIGDNCFILDHQVLNLDVKIGNNVTMWSANHIGDRSVIEDHVWVSSHVTLAGDVHVGPGCFLGTNASVSNNVRLGARTFVGTGAVITKDTADNSVHLAAASRDVALASDKFLAMLKIT
jgi:sugar O-acyltransferase (sialic acid O-acetyltransferase NeuD family)